MKKVCVVMPHYNQGKFLMESLETVAYQTYKNIEMVIFDDCSTDEFSKRIINKLEKENKIQNSNIPLKVIKSNKNHGAAHGRNEAINKTNADYILPLDSDDKIAPTYIEKAVKVLDSDKEIAIVYCKARFFGKIEKEWILPEFKMPDFLYGNCIFCSALFRRIMWDKVGGYNEKIKNEWEDYDLWLKMIIKGAKVFRINEVLFFYRQHENNYTVRYVNNKQNVVNSYKKILKSNIDIYKEYIEDIFLENISNRLQNYKKEAKELFHKYYDSNDLLKYIGSNKQSIVDLKLSNLITFLIDRIYEDDNDMNEIVVKFSHQMIYYSEQLRNLYIEYQQLNDKLKERISVLEEERRKKEKLKKQLEKLKKQLEKLKKRNLFKRIINR